MTAQNDNSVVERVFNVISTTLNVERGRLSLDTRLRDDLEADSMALTTLAIELEETFDGTIEPEEAENFRRIGDIVEFIKARLASTPA